MAKDRGERAIKILGLIAEVLVPLGQKVLAELGRLRDEDLEIDWEAADDRFERACQGFLAALEEEGG